MAGLEILTRKAEYTVSLNRRRWFAIPTAAALLLASACASSAPAASAAPVLRIGVDLPITGREARAAVPALNGVRFFVQRHPSLDGFTVSLVTADDAVNGVPSPGRGAMNVHGFLADPSLVAMIGPFDSAVARKEIPIANAASLAMVTPATSNACLTRDVFMPAMLNPARTEIDCKSAGLPSAADLRPSHINNFFRLTTTDDLQGAAAADYAFHNLHLLRAAGVSDHEAYGQGLVDAFVARFTALGGTVVGRLELPQGKSDVTAFLSQMKEEGAQAFYYGGGTPGGGCGVRAQMKALFPAAESTPFFGADGIAQDPACVTAAGDNSPGIFATVPFVDASTRPGAAPTIREFKGTFGNTADYGPYTIVAYDATAIVYAALDRAIRSAGGRLPGRADVISELAKTSGLAGATGNLGFDAAGDTTNRVVSMFEATGSDPRSSWKLVDTVDYSAHLPY
jgi:branched-chain amino acid transport system substrate-binding protein